MSTVRWMKVFQSCGSALLDQRELCTPRCGWPTGRNWGHAEVVAILSPAVGCMRPVSLWCFVPVLWEFGPGSRAALSLVTGCVPITLGRLLQPSPLPRSLPLSIPVLHSCGGSHGETPAQKI